MTTTLDTIMDTHNATDAAARLRATYRAARLSFTWLGIRKTLTKQQRQTAAEAFDANGDYVSAGKKILDNKNPAFAACTSIRNAARDYWIEHSLPYPEDGIRLIRERDLDGFVSRMESAREQLTMAVRELAWHFDELKSAARDRLGDLYNPADYPDSGDLQARFGLAWDLPSVEPPDYLQQLRPDLYAAEQARVAARFDEACRMAEEAFAAELSQIVEHLVETLSGEKDGKPKQFKDSLIGNLTDFFERFRTLNIGSSAELDALVDRTQQLVHGVTPRDLRTMPTIRQTVASQLSGVSAALDGMLVDRPRRRIIRSPQA